MRWLLVLLLALGTPALAQDGPGREPSSFSKIYDRAVREIRGALETFKEAFSPRPKRPPFKPFSFAVITDFQTGEGHRDFGTPGYDDSSTGLPEGDRRIEKIVAAIEKVNRLPGIDFVFVAGDLTNSAERSEYQAAKEMLDELSAPYIPIIGNHDIRPYVWRGEEAPDPIGIRYFRETFGDYLKGLPKVFPGTIQSVPEDKSSPEFINFTFEYRGIGFIVSDWNSRTKSPFGPGASPGARLHDFAGGTYRWLEGLLKSGWKDDKSLVFLFQHHPFRSKLPREIGGCFSRRDTSRMKKLLKGRIGSPKLAAVLAGHQHRTYDGPAFDGWPEFLQIETDSAKEESSVTVVTVSSPGEFSFRRY